MSETKNRDYWSKRWQEFDHENNLKVTNIDWAERQALHTVFWDAIVANRKPILGIQFQYWLSSEESEFGVTWTWAIMLEDSMLKLSTWASASSSAYIQSTEYLKYIPWHEGYAMFTAVFDTPAIGSTQRAWLYDSENWFAVWYNDTDFQFTILRDSVETNIDIDVTNIFEDWVFDPTKWNIYRITFAYLGFWTIHLEVATPTGGWTQMASVEYPNTTDVTHIKQTFLPLRWEVINDTNATNLEVKSWSLTAWVVDWWIEAWWKDDPSARNFTKDWNASASNWVVFSFRNKDTYNGIDNRVSALLKLISCATDWTKNVKWKLLKNPATTWAETWSDVSTDSVLEISTDLILDTWAENWEAFLIWEMAKIDTFFENVIDQDLLLPPWGVASFYFESAGSTDVEISIRWAELF